MPFTKGSYTRLASVGGFLGVQPRPGVRSRLQLFGTASASASYHGMYGFCVGFAALQNTPFLGCKAAGQAIIHQKKEGGGK